MTLFLLSFAESSCFPIPPDVLLIALAVGQPLAAFQFSLICSISSVLGGLAGYGISFFAFETIGQPILNLYDPDRAVFNQIQIYTIIGVFGAYWQQQLLLFPIKCLRSPLVYLSLVFGSSL